jgi:hypothetical protein
MTLDFAFDAEYGVVLRRAISQNGRCIDITEATAVRFNDPIEPHHFVFAAPDTSAGAERG